MVLYCCRDHQIADFEKNHKVSCLEFKKSTAKMIKEENILHAAPVGTFWNGDPFVNSVGHFWGIHETRDYMRARFAVAQVLERMGSKTSLLAALDHLMDQLRLCRGDNLGVREFIPGIMLRIGKDQECYDFIKWSASDKI